jgi:hypothetical protein
MARSWTVETPLNEGRIEVRAAVRARESLVYVPAAEDRGVMRQQLVARLAVLRA